FYNLLSCAGIPTTFVDQSVANSASITDWNWNFGGLGSIAGINNPSFKFPSAGDYNVQLTVTNSNGCREDTTILTTVEVAPIADFSYDSVCGKTPVTFKFLGTVAPPNTIPNLSWGKWDFGDNQIETAIKSPQHVYNAPGTYEVKLIVNSSNQCVDTVVKQVKVFDFPVVDFNVSQTQCVGKEIQFTDISATPDGTPINTWNWFFSGQSTSDEQNPRYTFNEEGNYIIQLTAKNSVGCTGTKLRSIAVSSLPTPKFTFSPQNGLPPLCVTYTNQSPFSGNYLWSYGDGGPLVEAYNPPQHCYNTIGTYPIKLIATDFRGCTDTLTKFILVDKAYLDGVMTSITIIPTNGDFYKIQVSIKNNSNIQITDLGLSLQLGGGSVIRENWTGSLLPGQTTVYLFTGEIKLSENNQSPIVCASIDNVNNNAPEDRTDNNTTCKEVKVGNFDVFNIYPNPAFENINFGVMLPKDGRVTIRFIDILGQLMYNKDFDGLKGYNNFQMSTMPLNAAVYVAEIFYDGQVIREKFMRKDRK
ncbi:MAG TPA: PKD domain-containing protein, partial [Chitinophagales bacterium]|nr:PKD domain-containing protein [Chitinophagales bacterium]